MTANPVFLQWWVDQAKLGRRMSYAEAQTAYVHAGRPQVQVYSGLSQALTYFGYQVPVGVSPLPESLWGRQQSQVTPSPLPPSYWIRTPQGVVVSLVARRFGRDTLAQEGRYGAYAARGQTAVRQPQEYAISPKAFIPKGTRTWTEKEFEREFGVDIPALPLGTLITGYTKQELERTEKIPLGVGKTWRESEFEREFGVEVAPDLPSSAVIVGYTKTAEGYNINYYESLEQTIKETSYELRYVPPGRVSAVVLGTAGRGGRWGTEFDSGFAPHIAPLLIKAKEEKWPRLSETLAEGSFERGLTSSVESTLEIVFPYPTPTPKHHELGYLILEAPPAEKLGYLVGTLGAGLVIGYGLSGPITWGGEQLAKVTGKIAKVIPESVKQSFKFGTSAKAWTRMSGFVKEYVPSFKGSSVDVWLAKHSNLYYRVTGGVAKGEIALGSFERLGVAELETEATAWAILGYAPRMGGVYIARSAVWGFTGSKVLPHLIYHGGKISVGYLRELSYVPTEAQMTPFVSQQQLTRMGIHPFIPKVSSIMASQTGRSITQPIIGGVGIVGMAELAKPKQPSRLKPKFAMTPKIAIRVKVEPMLAFSRVAYNPLVEPSVSARQRERALITPKAMLRSVPVAGVTGTTITATFQTPISTLGIPFDVPVPTVPKSVLFPYFPVGGGAGEAGFGGVGRGRWFEKRHRIKTWREMLETFGLKSPSRRVAHGKRRHRKR